MENEAHVAVAWGSPGGATADISIALEEIIGKRPKPLRLTDLGGPNETIQILLSVQDWIILAKAAAIIYGAELVKEAAKATWKTAAPKFIQIQNNLNSQFAKFVKGISQALHAKAPVVFGLHRNLKGGRRHIGIEIIDSSPKEIARIISILAENGYEIEKKLEEWDEIIVDRNSVTYDENSDCSIKLAVSDVGNVELRAMFGDNKDNSRETIIFEIIKKV